MIYNEEEYLDLSEEFDYDTDDENDMEDDDVLEEGYISDLFEEFDYDTDDENVEVLEETVITSASDVNKEASSKSVAKAKAKIDKAIASGKYRAFSSSDKMLLDKTIKTRNMLKTVGASIAGAAATTGGFVGGKAAGKKFAGSKAGASVINRTANIKKSIKSKIKRNEDIDWETLMEEDEDIFNEILIEEALQYYLEDAIELELLGESIVTESPACVEDKSIVNAKKKRLGTKGKVAIGAGAGAAVLAGGAVAAKKIYDKKKKNNEDNLNEEFYEVDILEESADYDILDEKLSVNPKAMAKSFAKGAGYGAVAGSGAAIGALAAKDVINNMKYSLFNYAGMPIVSFYSSKQEASGKGKSVCYALATKVDNSKIMMVRVNLK